MKNIIFLWLQVLVGGVISLSAQSLFIGSGANFHMDAGANLSLKGNLTIQNTNGITGAGSMTLNGTSPQTITSVGIKDLQNIILNNSAGITFSGDIKINGNLEISSATNLTFGSNAQLILGGNLTNAGPEIIATNLSLSLMGSGDQNINSKKIILKNLNFSGFGKKTLNDSVFVTDVVAGSGSNCSLDANGKLILRSTSTSTARVAALPSGVTILGNYTMERFIPATRKYRFIASPVVGGTALQWRNNGNNIPGKGTHITGAGGTFANFDSSRTNNPSAFFYDEPSGNTDSLFDPGWKPFTSGNMVLENGTGYRLLVRGDRTIDLSFNDPTRNSTVLSVTGTYPVIRTKNLTYTTSSTDTNGWHLLGNPFPSPIRWSSITKNGLFNSYSVWDPFHNRYEYFNGSLGDAGDIIQSSQAFFVRANSSGASIRIEENHKADSNFTGFFGKNQLINYLKLTLFLDSLNFDKTFLQFRPDAKNETDRWDAIKMGNSTVNVSFVSAEGIKQSIASYGAMTTDEIIVPISVSGSTFSNNYQLKIEGANTFEFFKPYIQDKIDGTIVPLTQNYTQTLSIADNTLIADGRLSIVFKKITNSTNSIEPLSNFFMYPNPANELIFLAFEGQSLQEDKMVELFDINGKKVWNKFFEKGTSLLPISVIDLSSGIYFVNISTNSGFYNAKFIKN